MKFQLKKLKLTPHSARYYLFFALLLIAAPTIMYKVFPSQAGRVLVAAGVLSGEPFEKTVIYLSEHHGYGATGFILNKELNEESSALLQARFPLARHFYYGGPVDEGSAIFLMTQNNDGTLVFFNARDLERSDPERYNDLIQNSAVRIFSGYSGWGPLQLNREIMRGGWNVIDFEIGFLSGSRADIWRAALERVLDDKKVSIEAI